MIEQQTNLIQTIRKQVAVIIDHTTEILFGRFFTLDDLRGLFAEDTSERREQLI